MFRPGSYSGMSVHFGVSYGRVFGFSDPDANAAW